MGDWFKAAFDREYLAIYAHRNEADAARALEFLKAQGVIHPGDRVLDLCCGNGRHSIALRDFGCDVVGFDLSQDLLRDFQKHSEGAISMVRGDMRRLSFLPAFDVVVNLFTSFGYFDSDQENFQVIRGVAKVLKPGGRYALDFLNAEQVRSALVPVSARDLDHGYSVHEERRIENERVEKTVELFKDGETIRRWEESVRLFTAADLTKAFTEAGFSAPRIFGDFDGSPHTAESPRTILVASLAT